MPAKTLDLGAIARVYIGDTYATPGPGPGSNSSAALTLLTAERTKGGVFRNRIPQEFVPSVVSELPNDWGVLSFNLTFYGAGDQVMRVANGNSLSAARQDTPSQMNHFTVLLVHLDPTLEESYLIPECQVVIDITNNREKNNPVEVPILFRWKYRDRFIPQPNSTSQLLYEKDTLANLATMSTFGSRCPTS